MPVSPSEVSALFSAARVSERERAGLVAKVLERFRVARTTSTFASCFDEVYFAHLRGSLLRRARRGPLRESGIDPEDVVHEALSRSWESPPQGCARPPVPWCFTVYRNCEIDALRRRRQAPSSLEAVLKAGAPAPTHTNGAPQVVARDAARHLLGNASAEDRPILEGLSLGLSHREIARAVGVPKGTVHRRVFNFRNRARAS